MRTSVNVLRRDKWELLRDVMGHFRISDKRIVSDKTVSAYEELWKCLCDEKSTAVEED